MGALAARKVKVDKLTSDVTGEVELEQNVLVLKRIHVVYNLTAPNADRETVERVHSIHHQGCPVYQSIIKAIDITTELRLV